MFSKIRPANWLLMLLFSFGLLVPAGWIVALPTASAQEPTIRSPVDVNGFSCKFGLQGRAVAVESNGSPMTQTVTIGDHVWFDANENGIQDAYPYNRSTEPGRVPHTGVPGVVCLLCELGKAAPVASATSDYHGNYTFTLDVSESATYYIAVIPPSGFDFTVHNVNNNEDDIVDSDVDPATGRTDYFPINPGEGNHTLDVGLIAASPPRPDPVRMILSPSEITTGIGEGFDVSIEVEINATDQMMEEALAYLNFDPEVLRVQELTPGSDLPSVLRNSFDNEAGHIDFAANKPAAPYPSDTFTLATISFVTLRPTNNTFISFNQELPRKSDVTFDSRSVLSGTSGNLVSIAIPTAIDTITLKSDTVTSGAGWASGFVLLMLSLTMLVRWRRRRAL